MLDSWLLSILVCPSTKLPLKLLTTEKIGELNARIAKGELQNLRKEAVTEPLSSGLLREDGKVVYPIRDDIPILLADQAILLD